MGFRANCVATVWDVEPGKSPNITKVRISTSRKNKQTEEWEQDFSGFVNFVDTDDFKAGKAAAKLKAKDRIRILECDVTSRYDTTHKREFINYTVFNFEDANGSGSKTGAAQKKPKEVATNDYEGDDNDDNMPF